MRKSKEEKVQSINEHWTNEILASFSVLKDILNFTDA